MAEEQSGKKSAPLQRLTQERFKEEVARELGIDLNDTGFPQRHINKLERDLRADGEAQSDS